MLAYSMTLHQTSAGLSFFHNACLAFQGEERLSPFNHLASVVWSAGSYFFASFSHMKNNLMLKLCRIDKGMVAIVSMATTGFNGSSHGISYVCSSMIISRVVSIRHPR